jgi:hypothetical protein
MVSRLLTLAPGYYPGGFKLSQGNKIKLLPGVYAFEGATRMAITQAW